jgi:oleate hydratase
VIDLGLTEGDGLTVESITWTRDGAVATTAISPSDVVMVTNGSMTANSTLGSTTAAPVLDTTTGSGAWALWRTLAAKRPGLGNPAAFDSSIPDSRWESFTVTTNDPTFFELMQEFSGRPAGKGGLLTLKDSRWLLTIALNHQPHFRGQPDGTYVWWGYALFPDRDGDFIGEAMTQCTGREILDEVMRHLQVEKREQILDSSIVIPALMPYITSQFLVRSAGDRPDVVPSGSTNLAFIGQYAEVEDDVVFTVEYSVRTAWTAVATLLRLDRQPPPVYQGRRDPKVLVDALQTLHRR